MILILLIILHNEFKLQLFHLKIFFVKSLIYFMNFWRGVNNGQTYKYFELTKENNIHEA
jgi:hypothetical protein